MHYSNASTQSHFLCKPVITVLSIQVRGGGWVLNSFSPPEPPLGCRNALYWMQVTYLIPFCDNPTYTVLCLQEIFPFLVLESFSYIQIFGFVRVQLNIYTSNHTQDQFILLNSMSCQLLSAPKVNELETCMLCSTHVCVVLCFAMQQDTCVANAIACCLTTPQVGFWLQNILIALL